MQLQKGPAPKGIGAGKVAVNRNFPSNWGTRILRRCARGFAASINRNGEAATPVTGGVNWVFLTGEQNQLDDSTRKLAKAYGLEFTPDRDGVEMHGVVTYVIAQHRRMLARFHGLDFDQTNFILFVNALTNHLQDHRHDAEPGLWSKLKGLF
jgi:hypothetical protein